jgi:hypothetical protein
MKIYEERKEQRLDTVNPGELPEGMEIIKCD